MLASQQKPITKDPHMMTGSETGAAGFALLKTYGLKAVLGMVGAAMLYFILPPLNKDGSFNKHEFVCRLAVAGICSVMFGDWAVDILNHFAPWLKASDHRSAVDLMIGAPGWWASRAVAIYAHKRRDKDILQLVQEVRSKR
jgi:hypothetical protein